MSTQEFSLIPKKGCLVQKVGFRPSLIEASVDYGIKVCPLNKKDGSVYIAIKGKKKDIKRFWNDVKKKKILPPLVKLNNGKGVDFTTTELSDRMDIPDTDIDYCLDALQLGQSRKGVKVISEIGKGVSELGEGVFKLDKRVERALEIMLSD